MSKVIGIDLGTTYSVMAYVCDGKPVIISNREGKPLTPSVVGFDHDGRVFVGESAKARAVFDAERTIASIKRKMGSNERIVIDGREFTPQEISAYILRKLKQDAEEFLGEQISQAVITVPAYFNDAQRQATKEAGRIAGLEVLRIINEPTAATLAYGLDRKEGELVMVWDLGGGTFDVSILEFSGGVYEVKSTSGNMLLGGDDWTDRIAKHLKGRFESRWNKPLSHIAEMHQRLLIAAEAAKCDLTGIPMCHISCPFLKTGGGDILPLAMALTRLEFEELTRDLVDRLLGPAGQALRDASIERRDIEKIVLVGGASRMPMVRQAVADFVGMNPYVDIDPDEAVAIGAAIQAGVLTGEIKDVVLVDVIPLSLGIETKGGIFTHLIKRNSTVPITKDRIFTTAEDDQQEVDIHILQGERELAANNVSMGKFTLTDIPPVSKGIPKINVTFSVDANGILKVSAEDVYTGTEQNMLIRSNRLSQEEIDKMMKEAESYKALDEGERERIEARLRADNTLCAAASTLDEIMEDISGEQYDTGKRLIEKGRMLLKQEKAENLQDHLKTITEFMDGLHDEWKTKNRDAQIAAR